MILVLMMIFMQYANSWLISSVVLIVHLILGWWAVFSTEMTIHNLDQYSSNHLRERTMLWSCGGFITLLMLKFITDSTSSVISRNSRSNSTPPTWMKFKMSPKNPFQCSIKKMLGNGIFGRWRKSILGRHWQASMKFW